ncbi:MAG: hypothetical protein MJZ72_09035 [Bacteroidales bacterium]|nr:hypothetical protein [Bacteroidales bacterium]
MRKCLPTCAKNASTEPVLSMPQWSRSSVKCWRRSSGRQSRSAATRSLREYRLCPWKGYTNISGKTGKTEGNYTCIAAIGSSIESDMSELGSRTSPTGSAYTNAKFNKIKRDNPENLCIFAN